MKCWIKSVSAMFAICLCTSATVNAAGATDENIAVASEACIQKLQESVNGDVFETVQIVDKALGEVVETEEGFEFGLVVTLKSKPVAKSGWDTYYMQGMCGYFGVEAAELKELSEQEIVERLKAAGYGHIADKATTSLIYYAQQREFANTIESDNYYDLLVRVSCKEDDKVENIEVFHNTDDLAGERYKPINEYLIPDVEAMKADGRDAISGLVTYWEEIESHVGVAYSEATKEDTTIIVSDVVASASQIPEENTQNNNNPNWLIMVVLGVALTAYIVYRRKTSTTKS